MSTELVPAATESPSAMTLVRPLANPAELMRFHDEVTKIIQGALIQDLDYGVIPGTGDKPTLLKPGAEKLNMAFGAVPVYDILQQEVEHDRIVHWQKRKKEWNNRTPADRSFSWKTEDGESIGLYRYVVRCRLMRGERLIAEGIGSCSTMESKYVDRPRDCENTALKMGKKRAYVDATLTAYGLSNRFTQDVEEIRENAQAAESKPPYNPDNKEHVAGMQARLAHLKLDKEHWEAVCEKMRGKRSTELEDVISLHLAEASKI